tara:strand:+ start:24 stop:1028 length:1005 start_codon:yes stop_codon:yes gene_type:complete
MIVPALIGAIATATIAWFATAAVLRLLERREILDIPNQRSSHIQPTPRGGGIAIIFSIALAWIVGWLLGFIPGGWWPVLVAMLALALVSWVDDVRSLPVWLRLLSHIVAVAAALSLLADEQLVFQGLLPPWLDRIAAGIAMLWFINLYNFMDGIDGITSMETIAIGSGLFGAALFAGWNHPVAMLALVVAAATAGFAPWNWNPARIFAGDVGSVGIGYLLGWLLLVTAAVAGLWFVALILPLYYLADATTTLLRRALRGERIWEAHANHFYQRAARRLNSHAKVSYTIAETNAWLVIAAIASVTIIEPWLTLIFSSSIVSVLLWYFSGKDATTE